MDSVCVCVFFGDPLRMASDFVGSLHSGINTLLLGVSRDGQAIRTIPKGA